MKKTNRSPHSSQKDVGISRREALRRAAGFGALASLSSFGLGIPESAEAAEEGFGLFPKHPQWKFVFVNHVTTNPFFVPTKYGAEDACALLGCTYQWTGSEKSIATDMVNAMNTAISAGVDGIAVSLVDLTAFNEPLKKPSRRAFPWCRTTPTQRATSDCATLARICFSQARGWASASLSWSRRAKWLDLLPRRAN